MASLSPDVSAALASLQTRWGAAAPRVVGALATAPLPAEPPDDPSEIVPSPGSEPRTGVERVVRTGFPSLDAIVGPGGLPRSASVALRGEPSSGATTLALRLAAEAQTDGAIVAWLDLARALDPVEAVARGVRLDWLVVLTPETLLVALEPAGLTAGLRTAVAEATGLRLELARRSWIRLGRDVVGQRTEALVAHNRHGPPGRRATLRILYAEGGERDACLARDALLIDQTPHEAPDR